MRTVLSFLEGKRLRFEGVVQRTGFHTVYRGLDLHTLLVKNIKIADRKTIICDHIWLTEEIHLEGMEAGDIIQFDATVTTYYKGYKGRRWDVYDSPIELDYRLDQPTEVIRIGLMDVEEILDSRVDFSTNYSLPKHGGIPKEDWSNYFPRELKFNKKILELDLKDLIDNVVYFNLMENKDLIFIKKQVTDFKKWIKRYNEQFIEKEPIIIDTDIIETVKQSRWFDHFKKWTSEKLAIPIQYIEELISSLRINDIRNKTILKAKRKRVKKEIKNLKRWVKKYDQCLDLQLI